jgi:hypothetical protein
VNKDFSLTLINAVPSGGFGQLLAPHEIHAAC